jgi:perosamine synthetase
MRIGRTIPPASAPIYFRDIVSGIKSIFTGQREIDRLESELKEYFNMKHCFLVSSGKAALTIILRSLKAVYPDRDEVLIPAFTCYSVPSSIVCADLKVRLCDIDSDTFDFDFNHLSQILNPKLSALSDDPSPSMSSIGDQQSGNKHELSTNRILAIVPTHLFGLPANIDQLRMLVVDKNITIIEDAAQSMGSGYKGRKLGTTGDVNFFSLGRGKAISSLEGGIILTSNEHIADKIMDNLAKINGYSIFELIKIFFKAIFIVIFQRPSLFWFPKFLPFLKLGETIYDPNFIIRKMSPFQAGLIKNWKTKLHSFQNTRTKIFQYWATLFQNTSNSIYAINSDINVNHACASENNGSNLIKPKNSVNTNNPRDSSNPNSQHPNFSTSQTPDVIAPLRFPLKIEAPSIRDKILGLSKRKGLGLMPTYPDSIDSIPELSIKFRRKRFLSAKKLSMSLITFPVHPLLSQKDITKISNLVSKYNHLHLLEPEINEKITKSPSTIQQTQLIS